MPLIIHSDASFLHPEEFGAVRIGKTRSTLETVVGEFNKGETPEQIAENFPTLELADIYTVIGYYLRYRAEVDDYIREGELRYEQFEREHPELCGVELRKKILARHAERMANDPSYFAYRGRLPEF